MAEITYTQEIADEICERLANGESLRAICLDHHVPGMATIFRWLADSRFTMFREQYARAREVQAETLADEIIHISNTPQIGEKTIESAKGVQTITGDMIEHRRLQVDARKWFASKVAPKKYGDKIALDHAGEIKGGMSEEHRNKKLAALADAVRKRIAQNNDDDGDDVSDLA